MTTEEITLATALISALTALLGVVIGSVMSYFVSKHQLRTTIVGTSRKAWIDDLRLISARYSQRTGTILEMQVTDKADSIKFGEHLDEISLLLSQLRLMLTPGKPSHELVLSKAKNLYKTSSGPRAMGFEITDTLVLNSSSARDEFIGSVQDLLNEEWQELKREV